jgi:hypothetical protein
VSNNFTSAKVSVVGAQASVDVAQYLPFGVSVLTAVAMAAVAGGEENSAPVFNPCCIWHTGYRICSGQFGQVKPSQSNAPAAKPEDGTAHQKDSSKATGLQE